MPHIHNCKVCNEQVAICAGDCQQETDHYCSVHHPDPEHHVEPTPPLTKPITVRIEKAE